MPAKCCGLFQWRRSEADGRQSLADFCLRQRRTSRWSTSAIRAIEWPIKLTFQLDYLAGAGHQLASCQQSKDSSSQTSCSNLSIALVQKISQVSISIGRTSRRRCLHFFCEKKTAERNRWCKRSRDHGLGCRYRPQSERLLLGNVEIA